MLFVQSANITFIWLLICLTISQGCNLLKPEGLEKSIPLQGASSKIETKSGALAFGPLQKKSNVPRYFDNQSDCPYGEVLYISEVPINTFEIGISWHLDRAKLSGLNAYTSYRCIPR